MIVAGRCHGPGCQQAALVSGGFCSESCQCRWNGQFEPPRERRLRGDGAALAAALADAMPEVERRFHDLITEQTAQVEAVEPPPSGDPVADLRAAIELIRNVPQPEPVKLTAEQWSQLRTRYAPLGGPWWRDGALGDITARPVELVDTVEESTPYQLSPDNSQASFVPSQPLRPHFARRYLNEVVSTGDPGATFPLVASEDPQVAHSGMRGWLGRWLHRKRRTP